MSNTNVVRMTKKFNISSGLREWSDTPLTNQLYRVLYVDWTSNSVKLEGRKEASFK